MARKQPLMEEKPAETRRRSCRFCRTKTSIDYKNVDQLKSLTTRTGGITPRAKNGNCRNHQGQVVDAIKLARELAFIPYIGSRPYVRGGGGGGRDRDSR